MLTRRFCLVALSFAALVATPTLAHAAAGDVTLVSRVGLSGAGGNAASISPMTTQDGHFVAFMSRATNLTSDTVPGGVINEAFVRNTTTGAVVLASRADGAAGPAADLNVTNVSVSDDGNVVVFQTRSTNLLGGALSNGVDRVYVRNIASGITRMLNPNTTDGATNPDISADGLVASFSSNANYDSASGVSSKVYVVDDLLAIPSVPKFVSRGDGVAGGVLVADQSSLSANGRYVAMRAQDSLASTFPNVQVVVRDRTMNTTDVASRATDVGMTPGAAGGTTSDEPSISRDGRWVVFRSGSTNLTSDTVDTSTHVFERDMTNHTTVLVSRATGATGAPSATPGNAGSASVSDDGSKVMFQSTDDNLSPDDNNNGDNAFIRDTLANTTTLVHGIPGQTSPQGVITGSSISGDGNFATWDTNATLFPGTENASVADVFERDLRTPVVVPPVEPTPPTPPLAPHAHVVAGTVSYLPAFGAGATGLDALGPFASPQRPTSVTISVENAAGTAVGHATVNSSVAGASGPFAFTIADLTACTGCSLVVRDQSGAEWDRRAISFDGDAGETRSTLLWDRAHRGGVLTGTVLAPGRTNPVTLSVRVLDAGGHVLADTATIPFHCGATTAPPSRTKVATQGVVCPLATSYRYRLTGLPTGASDVTVQLRQRGTKGAPIAVDEADATLDASGETLAPDLTALGLVPDHPRGRVLYGSVAAVAPFAPGAARTASLTVPVTKPPVSVRLLTHAGALVKQGTVGRNTNSVDASTPSGYELDSLPACPSCTLELAEGTRVIQRATVSVPTRATSVTRRDLRFTKSGTVEFVEGVVDAGSLSSNDITVRVTDAASGKLYADSDRATQACVARAACPRGGRLAYRLGGVPADHDVVVTLLTGTGRGTNTVDTHRVHTADAGAVTAVPDLLAPVISGASDATNHIVDGSVLMAGAFAPGAEPTRVPTSRTLTVRVFDDSGRAVGSTGTVIRGRGVVAGAYGGFRVDHVPTCARCTIELVDETGTVQDRAELSVGADAPSVTRANLGYDQLPGGRYVQGGLVASTGSLDPRLLRVKLLDAAGHVISDTHGLPGACAVRGAVCLKPRFTYRLGRVPSDATSVQIVVLKGTAQVVRSTVQVAAGSGDTAVNDLTIVTRATR